MNQKQKVISKEVTTRKKVIIEENFKIMIYELTKEHLTEDDLKVIKHLKAIDNLFKKGNLTISSLFADNGTLKLTKCVNDIDYEVESYFNTTCDGGDPDRYGYLGLHSQEELEDLYENS